MIIHDRKAHATVFEDGGTVPNNPKLPCKGLPQERQRALQSIPKVPLPAKDPVFGAEGPLLDAWISGDPQHHGGHGHNQN